MFAAVLLAISLHVLLPAAWLAGRGESSARHRLTLGLVLACLSALPALPTLLHPLTIAPGRSPSASCWQQRPSASRARPSRAEMSTLLARADFDLQTDSANAAAALEQARATAARSPLDFLLPEIDRLESQLRRRGD